ncbi:MAG: 1-acyl-sn-glycerol-3-phosphate acyltransferase [Chitinophagales bacterium]|nr:1-acyl-sn-glycerol-3-phosphate acyltransferase [Chitinophagales bacterium]
MISNKKTLWYRFMRTLMYVTTRLFYKQIAVKYLEPLPRDKPIIFVGNHLSTFIDPILISVNTGLYPAFLTKSDVFQHPLVRRFLFSIRMLPIYRRRDGEDFIQRNEEVFDVSIQQLEAKLQFVIFAEGSHSSFRRLRELKKGFARIGFEALERNKGELDVQIVPVGVEYSDFRKMHQTVTQTYGVPIPLKKYLADYRQNPQLSLNIIKADVYQALQKLVVHIPTEEYYDEVEALRRIAGPWLYGYLKIDQTDPHQRMAAEQQMIDAQTALEANDPTAMQRLAKLVNIYQGELEKNNIRPWLIHSPSPSLIFLLAKLLLLILLSPLYLLGVLTSYLPYKLPVWFTERTFKDFMYHPAVNMTGGMVLFPLFWLVETVLVHAIWGNGMLTLAFALIMPIAAWFSLRYWIWLKKWWGRWRFLRFTRNKRAEWKGLKQQYEEIITSIRQMLEKSKVPRTLSVKMK